MQTPTTPEPVEVIIQDPGTGHKHRFTGATEAEAEAAAEEFFNGGLDQEADQ